MSRVKSAFEKAMEKMETIGNLSIEEKEAIRDSDNLRTLLASFYRGELSKEALWQKMKDFKPSLLKEAQKSMINSLRLSSLPEEFQLRSNGILAIESLKKTPRSSVLENVLGSIGKVQKEYQEVKEGAIAELRQAIESNPQMRMRHVKAADGRSYPMAMTVDEAIQARMAEFLPEHEKRYETLFARAAEKLLAELQ
ncbi:MAG: hypothetical protein M0Z79_09435 [Nitrospiraceae bacterium]|nr:hypothetical protein [Nitrospiraceae bacterium]